MDEKVYQLGIYVLILFEGILSIPLVIDSMMGSKGQNLIVVALILHMVLWTYGEIWRIYRLNKRVHVMGIVAFVISFVPLVGFLMHFIVLITMVTDIIKRVRRERVNMG